MGAGLPRPGCRRSVCKRSECLSLLWHLKCPRMSVGDTMPIKRLEKEEENQAQERVNAASEETIEDDEVVNEDEDDLEDLEDEEEEAAEDAETSRL